MQPAELRAAISYEEFRPFRLRLTDGREIVCVDRAHYAMANGHCIAVFETVFGKEGGMPRISGPTIIGCDQVVAVEPLDQ